MGSEKKELPSDQSSDSGTPKEVSDERKRKLAEANAKLEAAKKQQEWNIFIENASGILMEFGLDTTKIERDDLGNVTVEGIEAVRKHIEALEVRMEKEPFASTILKDLLQYIKDRRSD